MRLTPRRAGIPYPNISKKVSVDPQLLLRLLVTYISEHKQTPFVLSEDEVSFYTELQVKQLVNSAPEQVTHEKWQVSY